MNMIFMHAQPSMSEQQRLAFIKLIVDELHVSPGFLNGFIDNEYINKVTSQSPEGKSFIPHLNDKNSFEFLFLDCELTLVEVREAIGDKHNIYVPETEEENNLCLDHIFPNIK